MTAKTALFLFFIIVLSGILYRDSFSSYFFQDDWFSLRISKASNLGDFMTFFIPRTDVIYYRPLGMQVPFFVMQALFGVHPLPFRILTYGNHALNSVLVFLIVILLKKPKIQALLVSMFYATSAVHFTPFYWFATYAFVAGPTAFFLTFIFFLLFEKLKHLSLYTISLGWFVMGLFINEIVLTLAPLLFLRKMLYPSTSKIGYLIPYGILGSVFILFRFVFYPPPLSENYSLSAGVNPAIQNLKGYFLWSMQWPEEMKAQFVDFFTVNPQFITDFPVYFLVFTITFFVLSGIFFVYPAITLLVKYNNAVMKHILFGYSWFIIGLLPVIFFPTHSFSYYLPIALVGLLTSSLHAVSYAGSLYQGEKFQVFSAVMFVAYFSWVAAGIAAVDFNRKVHWAPKRAKLAERLIEYELGKGLPSVVYVPEGNENIHALNNQDAFRVIYGSDGIQTVYGQE